jgi:alginate O-acetyltransferase complex protein AlgI
VVQSAPFWIVTALTALIVWQLPLRFRDGFIALVSAAFLGWHAPEPVLMLSAWGVAFFFLVRPPAEDGALRRRSYHALLIVGVLGVLFWFKYWTPLKAAFATTPMEEHVIVPLGMSYFTFKLIHYAVEVAKGNIRDRRASTFASYLLLFPIFTAGPIERYDHYLANRETTWSFDSTVVGLTRIIHGLVKKMVIANLMILEHLQGRNARTVLAGLEDLAQWDVASFLFLYFLYVYFDFSAYSDICIGVSRLFGMRIGENFNFPLVARDINDFWKRWHMSLSGWCQAYVYLPTIGLTRNPYVAVVSTFVVMGLWHTGSLTRIAWGLYQAAGVIAFTKWSQFKRRRKWKALGRAPWNLAGAPITWSFMAGSAAFLAAEAGSIDAWGALRILAKFFFLDLPA